MSPQQTGLSKTRLLRTGFDRLPKAARRAGRRLLCLLCLAACLTALLFVPASAAENAALSAEIDQALRRYQAIGAAVVIAKDGEIVYEHYYGIAAKSTRRPITDRTYFRLASVTKMVTAIRVMQLVEHGWLDLDADISEYLGFEVRNPYRPETAVTLRMLMTHTASLNLHNDYARHNYPLSEMISAQSPRKRNWYDEVPGSVYRYSNFGAGIIGSILESVTGKTIQETVEKNVFSPMGLTGAYSATLLPDQENIPNLYNADGTAADTREENLGRRWDTTPDPDRHYRINVGSLWMRPADLCQLGIMLCDMGSWQDMMILEASTVQEMMADQRGRNGITGDTPYGLNLHREQSLMDGKTFYGHQGMSDGILCNLYFDPETRFVFVLCSNGCNNELNNRVAKLTRRIFAPAWEAYGAE
ncbi:MAG: beta-lactamase family protein [Clostridia bacterium]|nr:beta-lactamase family protein [Clostridia bacterium]